MRENPSDNDPPGSGDTIDRLREEANRRASEFEAQQSRETPELRAQLNDAVGEVRAEAASVASDVKSKVRAYAEDKKAAGADKLDVLARAADRAATEFEAEAPEAARYIREAAVGVQHFTDRVRTRGVEDLASDATAFARRQPWLVFGGAVIAGLAISRFLKSSSPGAAPGTDTAPRPSGGTHDYE